MVASVPKDQWPEDADMQDLLKDSWDEDYGDRRQEIVFIGLKDDMSKELLVKQLDQCLIKDYLHNPEKYQNISDPFPVWFEEDDDQH